LSDWGPDWESGSYTCPGGWWGNYPHREKRQRVYRKTSLGETW